MSEIRLMVLEEQVDALAARIAVIERRLDGLEVAGTADGQARPAARAASGDRQIAEIEKLAHRGERERRVRHLEQSMKLAT